MAKLLDDADHIAANLKTYIAGFSPQIRDILEHFDINTQINKLDKNNLLYMVVGKFAEVDLHPEAVSNIEMGYLYEELIRKFSELSNESAGEHFTPREVIKLMVNLLFIDDDELLSKPGIVKTMFDPACGTGGMLSIAEDHLRQLNPQAKLEVFGQELNAATGAVAQAELLLTGRDSDNIRIGNSLADDLHAEGEFDYLISNPPMGLAWKNISDIIQQEHDELGYSGRFGAGLPRTSDSSFLFLQHMVSKMKPAEDGGSRLAVVFNGSPLFSKTGGESEIRRWIIENDWLEAVVALPDQLFYNTGISTYFWIISNRKSAQRKGKVQLVDARDLATRMRRSVGKKRNELSADDISEILRGYRDIDSVGGQSTTFQNSVILEMESCAIRPWMFVPGLTADDFVEIGTVAIKPKSADAEALPVLRMSDLSMEVTSSDLAFADYPKGRYVECTSRDVVGMNGRYTALGEGFGNAATLMDVIRLPAELHENAELLALWLSSPEAALIAGQGSAVMRVGWSSIVPRELLEDRSLGAAATRLGEARSKVESLVESLFPVWPAEIAGDRRGQELKQLAAAAAGVAGLLSPLEDVFHRAEAEYPYQIAKLVRDYRLAVDQSVRLEAGLKLAEAALRTIGIAALAGASAVSEETDDRLLAPFERGISAGGWLSVIRVAQELGLHPAVGDIELFSTKKKSAGMALQECVEMRNEVHHSAGVVSVPEKERLVGEIDSRLSLVLDEFAFLASWEFLAVDDSRYSPARNFENSLRRLNGSHPDWETDVVVSAEPVAPAQLYLRSSRSAEWLSLGGFASVTACGECARDELYVLDRVDPTVRRLKSLRGHEIRL